MKRKLSRASVIPRLPNFFGPERGNALPRGLIGAEIVRFGTVEGDVRKAANLEGGGLVIDYRPIGTDSVRRAVFSFTEEGMWLVGSAKVDES